MNKLVLNTGLGFDTPTAEQIKIMHEVGWEGFFPCWEKGEDLCAYARLADELGMLFQSVHAPFGEVDRLWESEELGGSYADYQIECLRAAKDAGVDLVIQHAIIGMERCTPTALGLKRYEKIFTAAENLGVTVALENTEGEIYVEALMREFGSSPNVRFCIDTGHEMCYNECRDLIGKYADKLVSTHLNDNFGRTGNEITWLDDSHVLPFDGIADWSGIVSRLKAAGYKGDLTFELTSKSKPQRNTHHIYSGLDLKAFMALALDRAKRIREMMA